MPNTSPTDRISRLEAFRGLGAIAVIVTHCFLVVPWDGQGAQLLLIKLVCLFLNGHTALMIFFVISGYVLGLSLDKGASRPDNVSRFYVRRGFRIYPAHLVALGFIAIALSSFGHAVRPSAASQMFGAWFPATLSPITGLFNALLLRVDMNGVAWTLVLEVAISLVFPLLYWTSRRSPGWVRAAILVGLIGVSFAVGNRTTQASVAVITDYLKPLLGQFSYVPTILNSLALYGYVFYVGLTAEPAFKRLVPRIEGRWGTRLMWFALFVAVTSNVYTGGFTPTSLFIEVCGATFLVFYGTLTHTRNLLIKALDHPFFKWLGAISYSFYLYHFIIVYCIATALFRVVDPMLISRDPLLFVSALALFAFPVTAALGTASYHLVEAPLISYSKRVPMRRSTGVADGAPGRLPAERTVFSLLLLAPWIVVPVGIALVAPYLYLRNTHVHAAGLALAPLVDPAPAAAGVRKAGGVSHNPPLRPPAPVPLPFHLAIGDSAARRWTPSGWYDAEAAGGATFAWSEGEQSMLTVPLPSGRNIRLDFEALPFVFPRSPPQVVTIELNGTVIERVRVRPGRQKYSVVLPARALRASVDTLEFDYAYARSPREVLENSVDVRTLAVAWYSLEFSEWKP